LIWIFTFSSAGELDGLALLIENIWRASSGVYFMNEVWINLFLAWGVQAGSLMSPGPGVLFLLAIASSRGRLHALSATIGIGGAAVVWSTATVVGLSAMLSEAGQALYVMKLLAAGYLAWLSYKSFRSAASPNSLATRNESGNDGLLRSMGMGFVMQVSNPKAIFFWLAIASLGATAEGPGWAPIVFVIVSVSLSLLIHAGWAIVFSTSAALSIYNRAHRWVEGILGAVFAVAAVRLATSREV
jgi:threonine/homoserine/homoserine lactone efflux protein